MGGGGEFIVINGTIKNANRKFFLNCDQNLIKTIVDREFF